MGNIWLKIKIWTKVLLVALALGYVIGFAAKNSEREATIWYFPYSALVKTSVLNLVLFAFLSGIVVTILARTTFRTISQIRELRGRQATEKREREIEELKAKAGMLRPKPDGDLSAT
jgi:hypothetical protein